MTPAQRQDVTIPTGARWEWSYVSYAPGPPVAAGAVTAGQRVYVDGAPMLVARVEAAGPLRTTLTFGEGLYGDPSLTVPSVALLSPAEPVPVEEASAAYVASTCDPTEGPAVPILARIGADGVTVTLSIESEDTALMPPGSHSWDLYLRTASQGWQREVEGTLTVVEGDAPMVTAPTYVDTVDARPAVVNLKIYSGDDLYLEIHVTDPLAEDPVDLTGCTAEAEIRDTAGAGGLILATFTTTVTGNLVYLHLPGPDTVGLPLTSSWDVQLSYPDGTTATLARGTVTTTSEVTQ